MNFEVKMALNPQYEDIGKGFVQQYYATFDDPNLRANVANFYSVSVNVNCSWCGHRCLCTGVVASATATPPFCPHKFI